MGLAHLFLALTFIVSSSSTRLFEIFSGKITFFPPRNGASIFCYCILCLRGSALTHEHQACSWDIPAACNCSFPSQTQCHFHETKTKILLMHYSPILQSNADITFCTVQAFLFSLFPWTKCQEVTFNASSLLFCNFTVSRTAQGARFFFIWGYFKLSSALWRFVLILRQP